ncbi:hypothetical protein EW145_g4595 [Phellinidium pouzarii]|uniref:DNA replication ATP-dependent helicase/nuclease n=1 Tax=Phellinidium pouzarii TaxID=167371 RepID=A0A4S4L2W6_9AGAM|nr:hypothetical protein EW145_g4595 [Phellinidium pouzarii]
MFESGMAYAKPSAQEEASFMEDLLSGIDSSFFDAMPSPDPTPQKNKERSTRSNAGTDQQKQTTDLSTEARTARKDLSFDMAALLEGAEDWDWNDMYDDLHFPERNSTAKSETVNSPREEREPVFRCIVQSLGWCGKEICRKIVLTIELSFSQMTGDTINVIGYFCVSSSSPFATITISAKRNLIILHPDVLLTATSVANAPHCARRPLLSLLLHSTSDTTPALVFGNILHEVVQRCLSGLRWDQSYIEEILEEIVQNSLSDLVRIGVSVDEAKVEMRKRASGLREFGDRFIGQTPKSNAVLTNTRAGQSVNTRLAITQLLDVEEDIWAPSGLLYYTQSEEVIHVPAGWNELRGLIIARNELSGYLMRRGRRKGEKRSKEGRDAEKLELRDDRRTRPPFLPPTIDQERACGRCYVVNACMLYRKAVELVEDGSSPIAELYELKTGHLTTTQLSFFKEWEHLITLEEHDAERFRKELWTLGAREREEKGRCFADMVLDRSFRHSRNEAAKDNRIHQFTYAFVRQKHFLPTLAASRTSHPRFPSLLHGHITTGDAVTVSVSDNPRLLALARGFVLELTPNTIVVGVDHVLSSNYIHARSPSYNADEEIVFRIDKDEMSSGMARVRDNLAQLFYVTGDRRKLDLIVDLKQPEFDPNIHILTTVEDNELNSGQRRAVKHALCTRDYALILGMPGSGKTTTVAEIIRVLVQMGKTVLLTSYTHSAVDTILLKLKNTANFDILRLGNADKIHPEVREFTLGVQDKPTTVGQLEERLLRPPVVATTALSIDHALFARRRFDYCIVDEASQITLPTCVGPLRFADKFILVGDHFQLPPLVKSRGARKGGLDVSLFRRLSDAHPSAVVELVYQYRMNSDIMLLSNRLIYGDRLKCGSRDVAGRSLQIPNKEAGDLPCFLRGSISMCWLWQLMDERRKAIFVDTDALPAMDSRVGDLIQNEVEASLVQQLTEALLRSGIKEEQIGIISLYRQQIKLLSHLLQDYENVEILTADKSQGRDKDCIIISLVRANKDNQIGDLLKDWRRINVAFTRARAKLVVFGSRKTLKASPLFADFFTLMEDQGWILTLPVSADTMHQNSGCATLFGSHDIPKSGTNKRSSPDSDHLSPNEDITDNEAHLHKKIKKPLAGYGLAWARPILQDLINNTK